MTGADLARVVSTPEPYTVRPQGHGQVPRGRRRPGHQGVHAAQPRGPGLRGPGGARHQQRRSRSWPPHRTACSSATAPATRPRPGTRWTRCAGCSARASRCSASAWAARSSRWRSAWAPTSSATATAASTSRCWTWPPAASTSPATTTASPPRSREEGRTERPEVPNVSAETSHECARRFRGNAGARHLGACAAAGPAAVRDAVRPGGGQPRQPQRRRGGGPAPARAPGVQRAVPPGGRSRPARRRRPLRSLLRPARATGVSGAEA